MSTTSSFGALGTVTSFWGALGNVGSSLGALRTEASSFDESGTVTALFGAVGTAAFSFSAGRIDASSLDAGRTLFVLQHDQKLTLKLSYTILINSSCTIYYYAHHGTLTRLWRRKFTTVKQSWLTACPRNKFLIARYKCLMKENNITNCWFARNSTPKLLKLHKTIYYKVLMTVPHRLLSNGLE